MDVTTLKYFVNLGEFGVLSFLTYQLIKLIGNHISHNTNALNKQSEVLKELSCVIRNLKDYLCKK